jgi:hypothetical protein
MPFIRKDFASVRSDEYPIRLWTVAVFLFGVLPLMHKRGIGRLIIGDEFDTSRRVTTQGIRHYDGLYDQSIWFDGPCPPISSARGWAVCQFSVLRPLSELLIEKILVKSYPHLQAHQTSCHATHKDDRAGQTLRQVRKVPPHRGHAHRPGRRPHPLRLHDMHRLRLPGRPASTGVYSQAIGRSGAAVLYARRNGAPCPVPIQMRGQSRPYPEIMQLRFDPKVSPIDGIPEDLRVDLYRILMEYAAGAVRRIDRDGSRWIRFPTRT